MSEKVIEDWNRLREEIDSSIRGEDSVFGDCFRKISFNNWNSIGCGPYRDLYKATQSKDLVKYVIDIRDGNVQLDRMFTDKKVNGKNRTKINQELLKFEHLTKFINSKPQFPTKFNVSWDRAEVIIDGKVHVYRIKRFNEGRLTYDLQHVDLNIGDDNLLNLKDVPLRCMRHERTYYENSWNSIKEATLGIIKRGMFRHHNLDKEFTKILRNEPKDNIYRIVYDIIINNNYPEAYEIIRNHERREELISLFDGNYNIWKDRSIKRTFAEYGQCKKIYDDLTYNVEPYVINRSSSNL